MALTLKSVWGHTERPWGYEVRVDFVEDTTGVIHNEVMTFKAEPPKAVPFIAYRAIIAAILARKASLESRIAMEAAEAAKPPEPTKEDLLTAKVAVLEAEKAALTKQVADLKSGKVMK
jgi:hypothetical protein